MSLLLLLNTQGKLTLTLELREGGVLRASRSADPISIRFGSICSR
jgi:hypothetical protein